MNTNEKSGTAENLGIYLDNEEWGDIVLTEEKAPGVFYLATKNGNHLLCREFYAVTEKAVPNIISQEALVYGTVCRDIRLFEFGEDNGWELIDYELGRYHMKAGTASKEQSLYCTALYAAEKYPDYFGGVTPPRYTPEGLVLRVKKVYEGIFFLETEQCRWMLALSYPIWNCDLSEYTQSLGKTCEQDLQAGTEEAAYLFFSEDVCAPALYELLDCSDYEGLLAYIDSRDTLETHLYCNFPAYTVQHNALEVSGHGKGDIFADILSCFGCEIPPLSEDEALLDQKRRVANCIHLVPGCENKRLLNLPK